MSRKASNMTLKPAGREACKRSRIVILAPSWADTDGSGDRHYGLGEVSSQDDSDGSLDSSADSHEGQHMDRSAWCRKRRAGIVSRGGPLVDARADVRGASR